jgi:hypothetical protein
MTCRLEAAAGPQVARLEDILRSKAAAGRPQDRQDVILLRELIRRRDAEK